MTPSEPSPSSDSSSLTTLQRVWAAALLGLVLLSWRLWMPAWSTGAGDFPRVPMLTLGQPLIAVVDGVGLVGLLVALGLILMRKPIPWQGFAGVSLALACLFLTNQHRLQPWAYQGWLYGILFACLPAATAKRFLIALTISIYAYSALGKFDQQFLHTVGPDLVTALLPWLDRGVESTDELLSIAAAALPTAELGLAICLAIPHTRRFAGVAAIAMHGLLLIALGPLGLGHSHAVLAWNVFLAAQAWLVFVKPPLVEPPQQSVGSWQPAAGMAARLIVLAALGLPLLERTGYWDHWLSWSLYSPHTSRVDVQLHRTATAALPQSAAEFLRPSNEQDGWYDLALDRWSLAQLDVPVYPQARFQLGVAQDLSRPLPSPDAIRIKIRGVANRRTGQRNELWLIGRRQIEAQANRYWLLPHAASLPPLYPTMDHVRRPTATPQPPAAQQLSPDDRPQSVSPDGVSAEEPVTYLPPRPHGPWQIKSSRTAYQDPWLSVRRDEVIRPDGQDSSYAIVRIKPGICVIALDDEGQVHLTEEFHYAVGRTTIEGVSGGIEPGDTATETAQRELIEELGITARQLHSLGTTDAFSASIDSPTALFVATELTFGHAQPEATELIGHVVMPLNQAVQSVLSGEITHSPTCILLLRLALDERLIQQAKS